MYPGDDSVDVWSHWGRRGLEVVEQIVRGPRELDVPAFAKMAQ